MKSSSTTTVILELNYKEACWLKGVMQNPINCEQGIVEDTESHNMRKEFWENLTAQGIGDV